MNHDITETRRSAFEEYSWLKGVGLALLTLAFYGPALRAGFIWDDDSHFMANANMEDTAGLIRLWIDHRFYYPLTSTAWWFARRLFGLEPLPYHLLNIALHAANAVLLWRLMTRLRVPAAWLGAAVFALHPVGVQSVAWATELKNCLSGIFYLAALLAFFTWKARDARLFYWLSFSFFALAILSKTSAVTLPFALIAMQLWRGDRFNRRTAAILAPFFGLSVAAGLFTLLAHGPMVLGPEWDLSPAQRLVLAAKCVWFYLGKLLWPVNLSFVYPRWEIHAESAPAWIPVAGFALMFFACLRLYRRGMRAPLAAFVYFVGALVPVLNFFRMYYARYSYVADHWQYLAAMGALPFFVGTAAWWLGRLKVKSLPLVAAALVVILGGLTWRQTLIYRDSETLWLDVLEKNPNAAIAYNNLAFFYADRGDMAGAEAAARLGLERNPENPQLQTILGGILLARGDYATALPLLEKALAALPGDAEVLNNLGLALAGAGRANEAIQKYREALDARPDFPEATVNLAKTLAAAGRRAEAVAVIERGLALRPNDPLLLESLAILRF